MTTKWIDAQEQYNVGDKAFLILFSHENDRVESYVLRDQPAYTNQSHQPRLEGWCGSYNNTSTSAMGAWEVVRIAKSGRYLIQELEGEALNEFLEEMGYPELIP